MQLGLQEGLVRQLSLNPGALSILKDTYLVEFLDLPTGHGEADLHRGLLRLLKHFIFEREGIFALWAANSRYR